LTGILTALLAQNYSPAEAAILGVFLHGLAGDLAVGELGMNSLTATDVINHLPDAFQRVSRK
jgi:NAD(P)H-hydrate epimerase